jgi:hypothetical protein
MTSKPIGFYNSPELRLRFEEGAASKTLQARMGAETAAVELPESQFIGHQVLSYAEKIERLLRNCHLRPVYKSDQKVVLFEPLPPENKSWARAGELPLPNSNTKWITRSDGTISYISGNSVITWNWAQNTRTLTSYKTIELTFLTERSDGSLVVVDKEGNLHIADKVIGTKISDQILNIIPLSTDLLLIKCERKTVVFDITKSECKLELTDSSTIEVLGDGKIASLKDGKITIYEYNASDGTFKPTIDDTSENKHIYRMPNSKSKILILRSDNKTVCMWDIEKNTKKNCTNNPIRSAMLNGSVFIVDDGTVILSHGKCTQTYSFKTDQSTSAVTYGSWTINCITSLSDGSFMLATDTQGATIHVIGPDGKKHWSDTKPPKDPKITSLVEMVDGSVAGLFGSSIVILKPHFNQPNDAEYQIEKLKLELKHNPYKLDLYVGLAKLYEANLEEKYHTYLAGLEAALRSTNLYQARRFYEKAKKLKPNDAEPCHIFHQYLIHSPYKKLKKQVALDLFQITKDESWLKKTKKYKSRLFVGEGTFTYTEALINKHKDSHPGLSQFITATEYGNCVDETTSKRCMELMNRGVTVIFGVDAQNLHHYFPGRRFERIQWNCPFGGTTTAEREAFKAVIPNFFLSSSQLQIVGDRIHVTLMQETDGNYWKTRQLENPIVLGAASASYRLIRKRIFGSDRYPGYVHVKTGTAKEYSAGRKRARICL